MAPRANDESSLVATWLDWLERECSVRGHYKHARKDCRESRKQALHGCATLEPPEAD